MQATLILSRIIWLKTHLAGGWTLHSDMTITKQYNRTTLLRSCYINRHLLLLIFTIFAEERQLQLPSPAVDLYSRAHVCLKHGRRL